jgi:restriction system protein
MPGLGMGLGLGLGRNRPSAKPNQRSELGFEVVIQQQLLDLVDRTNEGAIAHALSVPWLEIYRELERNPNLIYEFSHSPEKFEEFIAGAYDRDGWSRVILTPRSGDGGRDVIAEKYGFGSIRILDQCKAFSKGHLVGQNDVRAMIGVLQSDFGASKAVISTTSDFATGIATDPAIQNYVPYRLELRNGARLAEWFKKIGEEGGNQ